MAVREGFEPAKRYERLHTFQACSFSHSDTSPYTVATRPDITTEQQHCKVKISGSSPLKLTFRADLSAGNCTQIALRKQLSNSVNLNY